MAETLANVFGPKGDPKHDQFLSFLKEHQILAASVGAAAGAAAGYAAYEYGGFGWLGCGAIAGAGAVVGLLGASLAYVERPDFIRYHPWIAGISYVVVAGTMTVFLTSETAGLVNVPTAMMIGSIGGLAVVAMESALYDWFIGLFPSWGKVASVLGDNPVTKTTVAAGTAFGTTVDKGLQWLGLQDEYIDLDVVRKKGTPEEKALADQISRIMSTDPVHSSERTAVLIQQLKELLGHDDDPDADATFTDNNNNPVSNGTDIVVPPRPEFTGEPYKGELSVGDLDEIAKNTNNGGIAALARSTKAALLRAQASNDAEDIDEYEKLVSQLRIEIARYNAELEDAMDD